MAEQKRIRVMIADDHRLVLDGLETFLSVHSDIELVGKATGGREAVQMCSELRPDVVLMDLEMPDMDGVTAMRQILTAHPDIQIIALTSFGDKHRVQAALEAGASGYLLKDVSGDELAEALRQAAAGQLAFAPGVTQKLIELVREPARPTRFDLTWREREVLKLLVQGMNNHEIAGALDIKTSTVKTHIQNLFAKLGVSNRVEAATLALKYNLVDDAD
ncbi:MAG TPA: response regulator transcription factor [Aggregatilineales bacterium]|nr:response regulator transcription factor [Aggregatilineales bacterium]HPV07468.1 response regulator transcription factor [Aggregatilineales bacterium]HQA69228.1 response regulator transcription factor [Aggregatilineales bacterium]HQE17570.1 response regulator transcription factor [Aggregatilineales bacterium]